MFYVLWILALLAKIAGVLFLVVFYALFLLIVLIGTTLSVKAEEGAIPANDRGIGMYGALMFPGLCAIISLVLGFLLIKIPFP
jgi:hypothetical protein